MQSNNLLSCFQKVTDEFCLFLSEFGFLKYSYDVGWKRTLGLDQSSAVI